MHNNNNNTFSKELQRLVKVVLSTPAQQSNYGTHMFIIPRKEFTVRFITDYLKLNQEIVITPYPLPRICETMQQLEGFQYATALDLNMGYYTIDILPKSCDLTTIVTEFGRFKYNIFQMEM